MPAKAPRKLAAAGFAAPASFRDAVFERGACTKCHTSVNQNTPLAPSLQGIGKGQKPEYLVESVLFPSKIIKTGFETERIVTKSGKMLTGLVKEDGAVLRVMNPLSRR